MNKGLFQYRWLLIALLALIGGVAIVAMGFSIATYYKTDTVVINGDSLNSFCLESVDLEDEMSIQGCPMAQFLSTMSSQSKTTASPTTASPTDSPTLQPTNAPTASLATSDEVNSLRQLVQSLVEQGLKLTKETEEYQKWVILGKSTCRDDTGDAHLYDFATYKKQELNAIINFDALGQTNLYFYPGITGSFPYSVGPGLPLFEGNTLDPEVFVKDVSITTALGFTLNISMLEVDFATDARITLFLKNLRDRGYLIDSNGIKRNNMEKRRYMTALSSKVIMNRLLPKIDRLINEVYNDITIYKRGLLSAYDDHLLTFFLSTHLGDAKHPVFVESFFKNFSFIVSSWMPSEPLRNESILYNNANADCVIAYFTERMAHIMAVGDTTTLGYYWQSAGMSPETTVSEAMHNWIAYRQFMHITDLVAEQSIQKYGAQFRFILPDNNDFLTLWGTMTEGSEINKVNMWREMMRLLLPNNAWFSRKPNAQKDPASVFYQRAINIPAFIQLGVASDSPNFTIKGQAYASSFNLSRYSPTFDVRLSDSLDVTTSIDKRTDYILFNQTDTPAYLSQVMREMGISTVDSETLSHKDEANMFPVFDKPHYAAFGLGWRACAGQNLVTIYGVRFMEKFYKLRFIKNASITSPMIPQAPLKSVPDNIFVDQVALKSGLNTPQ